MVQIGADRGGFYNYDRLENLFGLGIHSADRVTPEWQGRVVGDLVFADAAGGGGRYAMEVRPNEALVRQSRHRSTPATRRAARLGVQSWTFALSGQADGTTRLMVRERVGFGRRITQLAMVPIGVVSFVMTRAVMRRIKVRAERHHQHR